MPRKVYISQKTKDCVCVVCGVHFEPLKRKTNYCSKTCLYKKQYADKRKKLAKKVIAKEPRKNICETCGREFLANDKRIKYCSNSCKQEAYEYIYTKVDENRPFTNETVYLVKMWHNNGDSSDKIAKILIRPKEVIDGIIRGDYDEYERKTIEATRHTRNAENAFDVQEWT